MEKLKKNRKNIILNKVIENEKIENKNKNQEVTMKVISINLPCLYIDTIEKINNINGLFPSRSEFIRVAVHDAIEKYLIFKNDIENLYFDKKYNNNNKNNDKIIEANEDEINDEYVKIQISPDEYKKYKIIRKLE